MKAGPSDGEPRLGTGIRGLDTILEGGWPALGSYLVEGEPGSGKTTVGLHFLLAGAEAGERCLFLTLSETETELRTVARSHGWTLDGVEIVALRDQEPASSSQSDYSVFAPDEVELNDIMSRIRGAVERTRPARLVLDPISGIRVLSGTTSRYRQQILSLRDFLLVQRVTAMIVSDSPEDPMHGFLQTAANGVLVLRQEVSEFGDARRYLNVRKLRGASYQAGEHPFRIVTGGIHVFPRLEVTLPRAREASGELSSGIEGLDQLLGGGVERGSATVISGQSGVGKTTLALQFLLDAARRGEHVQVFSLDESEASMLHRADALGLPASELMREGRLKINRVRSTEIYPAEFALLVQRAVDEDGMRAVLIDSVTAYRSGISGERQLTHHLSQLLDYLSNQGVTAFLTIESADLSAISATDPFGVSYLSDNVILLRFFEAGGEVRRAINVLKKRAGRHETSIREFQLSTGGIRVGAPLDQFRGVLGGSPEFVGEIGTLMSPKQTHNRPSD